MLHKAVAIALEQALRFRQCWDGGVATIDVQEVASLEKEFANCTHFLVSCLNSSIQQSALPHCEWGGGGGGGGG